MTADTSARTAAGLSETSALAARSAPPRREHAGRLRSRGLAKEALRASGLLASWQGITAAQSQACVLHRQKGKQAKTLACPSLA